MENHIINFIWFFFIYAFLGWATEVTFATCARGRFENRGFLNGPICPIYGFGVVSVILALEPLKGNFYLLFIGSTLVTSILELITGFLMEKIFKHRWWDYSTMPLNIGGYICLPFSLIWGLVCVLLVSFIHPSIAFIVRLIPSIVSYITLPILLTMFIADITSTSTAVFHFNKKLVEIERLAAQIHQISEDLGSHISETAGKKAQKLKAELESLKLKINEKISSTNYVQRRLVKAFPKMKSKQHTESLNRIREALRVKKEKQ